LPGLRCSAARRWFSPIVGQRFGGRPGVGPPPSSWLAASSLATFLIKGDLAEEVTRLKGEDGRELQVHGSGKLAQTLIQHDLIDEYRLWFHPVVLGSGKRLFPEGKPPLALKLVETKTTSTGVVIHVYQPAGKPELGSFAPGQE
jgi:RibD C-terminal domain